MAIGAKAKFATASGQIHVINRNVGGKGEIGSIVIVEIGGIGTGRGEARYWNSKTIAPIRSIIPESAGFIGRIPVIIRGLCGRNTGDTPSCY
jgi:hypothetical protein